MSNLTAKLISAGFLPEAKQKCDEALKIEDYHENVGRNLAKLKVLPKEEDKKEAELLENSKPKGDFYKQLGRATSRPDPKEIARRWQGPECVLDVTIHNNIFRAVGSYEQQLGPLAAALMGIDSVTRNTHPPIRYRVEYGGALRGRVIEARVIRASEDEMPKRRSTVLSSSEDQMKVLMALADDESEFKVMERSPGGNPRFYSLQRLPNSP